MSGLTAHIDPGALSSLQGKFLFYPAAGNDRDVFLSCFCDYVDEFHFCDITYNFDSFGDLFSGSSGWQQIERELQGKSSEPIETIKATIGHREYRYVEPGRLRQVYQRDCDGRRLAVIRRRGFGQYALAEFPDRSIGVFVHRGDSPGESGSNTYFLANKKRDHKPLSNLFCKLATKLADRALVVSDGSNVGPRFLKRFHNKDISGYNAFNKLQHQPFSFGPFCWKCVGFMSNRYGPTLVWSVERQP